MSTLKHGAKSYRAHCRTTDCPARNESMSSTGFGVLAARSVHRKPADSQTSSPEHEEENDDKRGSLGIHDLDRDRRGHRSDAHANRLNAVTDSVSRDAVLAYRIAQRRKTCREQMKRDQTDA